jgi:hypothetical protein
MSGNTRNKAASEAQKQRLRMHATAGLTAEQALDMEGADRSQLRNPAIKFSAKGFRPAVGSDGDAMLVSRRLANYVVHLCSKHDRYEVSRLLGMTEREQKRAMFPADNETDGPHTWTLPQMNRLARAYGMTLGDLLDHVSKLTRRNKFYAFPD